MKAFLSLALSLVLATRVLADTAEDSIVSTFLENYNSVWPDSNDKLAYTFLSSYFDDAGTDSASLVVSDDISLDPTVKPDAETLGKLDAWLESSSFDASIQYDLLLKSFQDDAGEVTTDEITRVYRSIKGPDAVLDDALSHFENAKAKRGCSPTRCLENFWCASQGGFCVCGGGVLRMDCKSL